MQFREPLPESCPPQDVKPPSETKLWRLVSGENVTYEDFDSHAKKFPTRLYRRDPCRARSTSLLTSLDVCRAVSKMPTPNVADLTHAVEVNVDPNAGVWDWNKSTHVSLWLAAAVNPLALTGCVMVLE